MSKNTKRYVMTQEVLARLETFTLREQFSGAEQKRLTGERLVHIHLREYEGNPIHNKLKEVHNPNHNKGILVLKGTVDEVLPLLVNALKAAGFEGKYGAEQQTITSKLLHTLRSFDPVPLCFKCRKALLEGQLVISIKTRHRRRIYHEECWDSIHFE